MKRFIEPATSDDYRWLAKKRLPRQIFDYLDGGAYRENTRFANETAWQQIRLRQRVLKNVSQLSLSKTLAGVNAGLPLALGPVGLAGLMARRGEAQAQQAAVKHGVSFCASTVSLCSIEEVVKANPERTPWFQLYMMKDRGFVDALLQRVRAAGVSTLVVTVDLARLGSRYRDIRNGFDGPQSMAKRWARCKDLISHLGWVHDVAIKGKPLLFGNLSEAVPDAKRLPDFKQWVDAQFDPAVDWQTIAWLRQRWSGRLIIKGIMDVEDLLPACQSGADGVVLSNHGGRQLDDVMPTAEKLPAMRRQLEQTNDQQPELWVDGGIHSGLDIAKALALGADGCLLGRAWAFALAARGEQGVCELLARLRAELSVAMTLMGVTNVNDLSRQHLEQ